MFKPTTRIQRLFAGADAIRRMGFATKGLGMTGFLPARVSGGSIGPVGAVVMSALVLTLGTGCSWLEPDPSARIDVERPANPEKLAPADFATPGAPKIATRPERGTVEGAVAGEGVSAANGSGGLTVATTPDGRRVWGVGRPGEPVGPLTAQPEATPGEINRGAAAIERPTLVDAKVGDINGRPIYAIEFLTPLAARLEAEARRAQGRAWSSFAEEQIRRELDALIEDELLRAEAIASLSPEQRQGLAFFLEQLRSNVVSRTGGSSIAASQRIERETGLGVEEFLDEQRTRELIRFQLERAVNNRVNVPWRDIVLEYQRQWEQFNPPSRAVFTMLRVPTAQSDAVEDLRARVTAGEDWSEIAVTSANNHARATNGQIDPPVEFRGELSEATLFSNEALNAAARGLVPGAWTGPLEVGSQSMWIRLDGIEEESVPLYVAQLRIERWLRQVREGEERQRYIDRLRGDARVTNTDEIVQRLLRVAEERYGPGSFGSG
jgi:hypothetical protein